MFIHVRLLKGFSKQLLYKVPNQLSKNSMLVGHLVCVPIQKRTEYALVVAQYSTKPPGNNFLIREIISVEPFPLDPFYNPFIQKLANYHQIEKLHFFKRIRSFLDQEQKKIQNRQTPPTTTSSYKKIILSDEQQIVTNFVINKIEQTGYAPTVLHGVTGSGKTECYKKMIGAAIKQNKTTLLMLPEITLALRFEQILRSQLPSSITLFGFHSATTAREKKLLWKHLLSNKPSLIIGVHLPVLLPISNLGLIIVDEEHETGYQEKKHPKINSKEAAILRAHCAQIPIVLGSATPSISSLNNVKQKNWSFFQLKKRFSGTFPEIKTVLLTDKIYRRNFWISQKLENAIQNRLRKKEQAIIFLNRRGFSFFVQCKSCGFIIECPNCSVSLTLHNNDILTCHYCEHNQAVPTQCNTCKETTFIKKGIGTQQVVTILQKLFPHARIGRADMDTTRKKTLWKETIEAFETKKLDILVGTQTITKGFHFPGVTLVGILWADLNLHFPVYNATETTLQQLIQVAGRAGRQSEQSTVIVQAMDNHSVFDYLNETDYLKFYAKETELRAQLNYPPFGRFAELELRHTDLKEIESESLKIASYLTEEARKLNLAVNVLGPAEPPVSRVKKTYIRKIFLKSRSLKDITTLLKGLQHLNSSIEPIYTPHQT